MYLELQVGSVLNYLIGSSAKNIITERCHDQLQERLLKHHQRWISELFSLGKSDRLLWKPEP